MSEYVSDTSAKAMVMLVVIDTPADGDTPPVSHEEYSYYASYSDALIASKALIEARGWTMPRRTAEAWLSGGSEYDQKERATSTALYAVDTECYLDDGPWADFDQHMGAVYAVELRKPAVITRSFENA